MENKDSIKAFTRAFTISTSSEAVGHMETLFTREQLLSFCIETGRIDTDEVDTLLDAAGEASLNDTFPSDYEIIACDLLLQRLIEIRSAPNDPDRYTDERVRRVYHERITDFISRINSEEE